MSLMQAFGSSIKLIIYVILNAVKNLGLKSFASSYDDIPEVYFQNSNNHTIVYGIQRRIKPWPKEFGFSPNSVKGKLRK